MNRNPNCGGSHCLTSTGEVRLLPLGGGAHQYFCHDCFEHEMKWRRSENRRLGPGAWDVPSWSSLEVYSPKRERRDKEGVRWPKSGYRSFDACSKKLFQLGFNLEPGSSRWIHGLVKVGRKAYDVAYQRTNKDRDAREKAGVAAAEKARGEHKGLIGRIVSGPGSGDTFYVRMSRS